MVQALYVGAGRGRRGRVAYSAENMEYASQLNLVERHLLILLFLLTMGSSLFGEFECTWLMLLSCGHLTARKRGLVYTGL